MIRDDGGGGSCAPAQLAQLCAVDGHGGRHDVPRAAGARTGVYSCYVTASQSHGDKTWPAHLKICAAQIFKPVTCVYSTSQQSSRPTAAPLRSQHKASWCIPSKVSWHR